jgi:hypothetical protein
LEKSTNYEAPHYVVFSNLLLSTTPQKKKRFVFWDITLCSVLKVNWHFGGIYGKQLATCFHADFLLGLFFDPKDGGGTFLQNVNRLSTGRILHSEILPTFS